MNQDDDKINLRILAEDEMTARSKNFLEGYQPDYRNNMEIPANLEDKAEGIDKCENPNDQMKVFIDELKELRNE